MCHFLCSWSLTRCLSLAVCTGVYGDVMRVKILFNKKENALVQMSDSTQAQLGNLSHVLSGLHGQDASFLSDATFCDQGPQLDSGPGPFVTSSFTESFQIDENVST